jgi:prephenate dehydrogenase
VQLNKAQAVWTALGCHVKQMSPEAHDAAYAAVSHLPHMIAFALMNAIQGQAQGEEFLSLAGPGFRDFTRIAASDPSVWRDILVSNREELLAQSKHFQRALHALEVAITSGNPDALEALIEQASSTRAQWRMPAIKPQS